MYVYIESEPGLWTVGHYAPAGAWHPESDHEDRAAAAARVARLNGAADPNPALVTHLRAMLRLVERHVPFSERPDLRAAWAAVVAAGG